MCFIYLKIGANFRQKLSKEILFEQKLSVKKHNNNVNEYLACDTEITVERNGKRERGLINSKPNMIFLFCSKVIVLYPNV